jgi:PH domain
VDLGDDDTLDDSAVIIHSGELKKKNKLKVNQQRTFVLFKDGSIHYYKDKIMYRGQISLTADSKVALETKEGDTERMRMFIHTPLRSYELSANRSPQ